MPADLTVGAPDVTCRATGFDVHHVVESVMKVISGALPEAAGAGIAPCDLTDAVELYHQAGSSALRADLMRSWRQVRIRFPDWESAEQAAATYLAPRLRELRDDGLITGWWFIRKHPCWRIRLRPVTRSPDIVAVVGEILDDLTASGIISEWRAGIFEPESHAFGGPTGMDIAHDLFVADSQAILASAGAPTPALGRRELSILLCTTMFRAAHQEWFEQGDIWQRVARMRPPAPKLPASATHALTHNVRTLLTADLRPTGGLFGPTGPLHALAPWAAAFEHCGHALAKAVHHDTLERGIRATCAHHIIFHWNRLGLSTRTQTILATTTADTIMAG